MYLRCYATASKFIETTHDSDTGNKVAIFPINCFKNILLFLCNLTLQSFHINEQGSVLYLWLGRQLMG